MSKTVKLLIVCLVVSVISLVIMVISAIISPEKASIPAIVCTGIVPIVIGISLLSQKKDDSQTK